MNTSYKQKATRTISRLKGRIVLDEETLIVLDVMKKDFESVYRLDIEIAKCQSSDSLDYKKLNTLISTRNSIQKSLIMWFDRLEWTESENSKLEELMG